MLVDGTEVRELGGRDSICFAHIESMILLEVKGECNNTIGETVGSVTNRYRCENVT